MFGMSCQGRVKGGKEGKIIGEKESGKGEKRRKKGGKGREMGGI